MKSVLLGKTLILEGIINWTYAAMITGDVFFQIIQLSKLSWDDRSDGKLWHYGC
jgi:hypothetical protein